MNKIKVMLVDDHELLITGFKTALRKFNIDVIKSLSTLNGVVDTYMEVAPDVLVLDVRFTGEEENGIDACTQVLSVSNNAKVIILSQFDQNYIIQKAYKVGALAFVRKDDDIEYLVEAIRAAHQGKEYFPPSTAQKLARYSVIKDQPLELLDKRELSIFKLVADGYNNIEIAKELNLSVKTIGKLVNDIKEKLSIDRVSDFTKLAIKYSLIQLD